MTKNDFKIFNFLVLCIILLGFASAVKQVTFYRGPFHHAVPSQTPASTTTAPPKLTYIPQFVLVSFDGSRAIDIWEMITQLKQEMRAQGKPLNVTHFINTAYFLTDKTREIYQGPHKSRGKTNIGISEDLEHIRSRINEVNKALADGDEIAVHTVGHFSGLLWSKEDWKSELEQFNSILFGLDKLYPDASLPKLNLTMKDVIGFRAPYLDHGPGLFEALHEVSRYRYDTSEVGATNSWPWKDKKGLWRIPLGSMNRGGEKRRIIAMDYNWYFHDSKAVDIIKKGTTEWTKIFDDTSKGLLEYFNENYTGNRAPVLFGYHFERWNDGVYMEVLKKVLGEVCGKPEVRCGTFKELVDYLDEYGIPHTALALTASAGDVHVGDLPEVYTEREQGE